MRKAWGVLPMLLGSLLLSMMVAENGPKHELLLVVNKGDRTLSLIEPESGKHVAAIPVGGVTGHEVAASPDGRTAWVPIYGNSGVGSPGTDGTTISVIDLENRAVITTIDLGEPSRPHCAVFNQKNRRLYVTTEITQSIKVIDPEKRSIIDSIPTGAKESHMLAISSDGERGYTANVGPGTVSAIDLRNKKVMAVIPVSKTVQRIAISPDDRWVFTADQTRPELAVIDTSSNTVQGKIAMPGVGYGMAITSDGTRMVVAHPFNDSVSFVDMKTRKVLKTLSVPSAPQEVLIPPGGQSAYVSCDKSRQVAVLDVEKMQMVKSLAAGIGADGLAWAGK